MEFAREGNEQENDICPHGDVNHIVDAVHLTGLDDGAGQYNCNRCSDGIGGQNNLQLPGDGQHGAEEVRNGNQQRGTQYRD